MMHHSQKLQPRRGLKPLRQHLTPCLGDQDSVLKLSRTLPICCDSGPVIRPSDVLVNACVDHWLDGEDMANFHEACGFVT